MDNNPQYAAVHLLDCLDLSAVEEEFFPVFRKENCDADICAEQFFRSSEGWNIYYADDPQLPDIHLHMHNYVEVIYFPDTQLEYLIESKIYRLAAGDILFIPSGFFHRPYSILEQASYGRVVLSMSCEFLHSIRRAGLELDKCLSSIAQEQHFLLPCTSPENKFIRLILQQMVLVSREDFPGSDFLMESFCAQIVLYTLHASRSIRLSDGRTSKNQLVRTALDYISAHICQSITLESIAGSLFVSKYHLAHAFKNHMGISIHQYIILKRIELAKSLIQQGKPMHLVCLESGFHNYSNFFKAFKAVTGVSPSDYGSLPSLDLDK